LTCAIGTIILLISYSCCWQAGNAMIHISRLAHALFCLYASVTVTIDVFLVQVVELIFFKDLIVLVAEKVADLLGKIAALMGSTCFCDSLEREEPI